MLIYIIDIYMDYSDNKELYDNYIPFQTGYIRRDSRLYKCEYCGKPNMNANCHAHEHYCPYYCGEENNMPIGDGLGLLITFAIGYFILKIIKRKINNL